MGLIRKPTTTWRTRVTPTRYTSRCKIMKISRPILCTVYLVWCGRGGQGNVIGRQAQRLTQSCSRTHCDKSCCCFKILFESSVEDEGKGGEETSRRTTQSDIYKRPLTSDFLRFKATHWALSRGSFIFYFLTAGKKKTNWTEPFHKIKTAKDNSVGVGEGTQRGGSAV